jgi:hypothetical protein
MDRLIDLPEPRVCPESLLAQLREVDPAAELIYVGEGEWWLGVVKPNTFRRAQGDAILGREWAKDQPSWEQIRYGQLMRQGFAFCGTWHFIGEPTAKIVQEFRESTWLWAHDRDQAEDTIFEAPERQQQANLRAMMKDRLHADGRSVYRHLVQDRRTAFSLPPAPTTH